MEALQNLISPTLLPDIMFYVFAAFTLLFGILVVANPFSRNPVTSAMFLVLTIISMAGLFVLLHAFFLAAVQVIVYAGAVMVLFIWVRWMFPRFRYDQLMDLGWRRFLPLALVNILVTAIILWMRA